MTRLSLLMQRPFNLSRNFNLFGIQFETWLARMLPLTIGADPSKLARDFRGSVLLHDMHRRALARLVAIWTQMHAPRPAA